LAFKDKNEAAQLWAVTPQRKCLSSTSLPD